MAINLVTKNDNSFNDKNKIDVDTALRMLCEEPQLVQVIRVDELRQSKKGNGDASFFYVDFKLASGKTFGVSYTVMPDEYGEIWCSNGSKLFALLKGLLEINEFDYKGVSLTKADIDATLMGQTFIASGVVHTFGGHNHIYLTSEMVEA